MWESLSLYHESSCMNRNCMNMYASATGNAALYNDKCNISCTQCTLIDLSDSYKLLSTHSNDALHAYQSIPSSSAIYIYICRTGTTIAQ